tara:strand:+ start:4133 stop:4822 length:690 start_codon:yes stop_codon:yes gene_type:complete
MIPLLALQSRDLELRKAVLSLQSFPQERERIEGEMAKERQRLESARNNVRESEVLRERMESDAEAAADKIRKLKNQQLEVRKNEEYQALTHEIDSLKLRIDEIEEKEIILLDEIEEEKAALAVTEQAIEKELEAHRKTLARIDADEADFRERLSGMKEDVEGRRAEVDADLLSKYDSLWKQIKRPPVLVPLANHTCGGCHLRVSNEIDAEVQAFNVAYCDSCGRMLFVE